MKTYWEYLSERERMLIIIGGALAGIFIVLQLILSPVMSWRADQTRDLANARTTYELVAEAAPLGGGAESPGDNGQPVRTVVSDTARQQQIEVVYINARGDGAVDVNIASVAPEALYGWLSALRSAHGVAVDTADIARETGNPQNVRAQLTLSRRGGG